MEGSSVKKNKIKNNLYLPLKVFIAHRLAGPRKQLKQIIQIENNIVNIEESQLAGDKSVGYLQT